MSLIFPRNSRAIAGRIAAGVLLLAALTTAGFWYYGTPKYYRVGYAPIQPVPFSHAMHVTQVGLDCLYCHTDVKQSSYSNIPTTQSCWNCHGADKGNIRADSSLMAPLREAHQTGRPINWVHVNRLPDFAYFNHEAHVNRGVSCASCHGQTNDELITRHNQPLSMAWCLDCHRNPDPELRPNDQVTNLTWDWREDPRFRGMSRQQAGAIIHQQNQTAAPVNCSACHR